MDRASAPMVQVHNVGETFSVQPAIVLCGLDANKDRHVTRDMSAGCDGDLRTGCHCGAAENRHTRTHAHTQTRTHTPAKVGYVCVCV